MPAVFRGIDIAGDKGETGLVDLVERADGRLRVRWREQALTGSDGLTALRKVDAGESLMPVAIDQPLGFPAGTLRMLAGLQSKSDPVYDATQARFREADLAMREDLGDLNRNYVLSPVVCDNVWRASHLIRSAGVGIVEARRGVAAWIETHPRLCVVRLLRHTGLGDALASAYKVTGLTSYKTYLACGPCLRLLE